jgi:hypothetical protein
MICTVLPLSRSTTSRAEARSPASAAFGSRLGQPCSAQRWFRVPGISADANGFFFAQLLLDWRPSSGSLPEQIDFAADRLGADKLRMHHSFWTETIGRTTGSPKSIRGCALLASLIRTNGIFRRCGGTPKIATKSSSTDTRKSLITGCAELVAKLTKLKIV